MGVKVSIQLDADTSKLSQTIQQAVAKGFRGGSQSGLATSPAKTAREIAYGPAVGMKGYNEPMGGTSLPYIPGLEMLNDPKFFFSKNVPPRIQDVMDRKRMQNAQFLKNMEFAALPLLRPQSAFGNLFAARQIFSAFSGEKGQSVLSKVGLGGSTAGAAIATGTLMAGLLAVGVALKGLEGIVKGVSSAFDEARQIYSKSLLAGTGLAFNINRKNMADVLGVSEKEVFKFADAMALLGPRLKFANDTMAKTTPELATVSAEFGVLKKDLQALFFEIANQVGPSLVIFMHGLETIVNGITGMVDKIGRALQEHPWLAQMLFTMSGGFAFTGFLAAAQGKTLGQPQGMMKQMPVSALERMGLVVHGFGGATDYARRTAQATERTAKSVATLAMRWNSGTIPRSGYFGFYDYASNP